MWENVGTIILALIGFATAVISALIILVAQLTVLRRRLNELAQESRQADQHTDRRVDAVWQANAKRGKMVGVEKGVIAPTEPTGAGVANMPSTAFAVRPDVRAAFRPILSALKALHNPTMTDGQWAEVLSTHYDDWILRHICGPLGMSDYECWAAARVLAAE